MLPYLQSLQFNEVEKNYLRMKTLSLRQDWAHHREEQERNARLRLGQIKDRLNRLTDAYLDGILDRTLLEERKTALFLDQKQAEETLARVTGKDGAGADPLERIVELADTALLSYQMKQRKKSA